MARRHLEGERGQALILITVGAILIFAMMGLVVDIGWGHFRKNAAQAAADSAALAAVTSVSVSAPCNPVCASGTVSCQAATTCPSSITDPPANNLQAGCLYAKSNGFQASGNQNVTMAGNTTSPPTNVSGVTVKYWATATITETETQLFSAILGNKGLHVAASATAAMLPGSGGGCIYVMDASGSSVTSSGAALLQSACGIYINSSSSSAVTMSGSATIKTTGGAKTNIVGNPGVLVSGTATVTPSPNVGVTAASDPFASMNPPTVGACTYSSPVVVTTNTTLNPGVYCGGIITSGTETITLNGGGATNGLYVIKSGITESGSPTFNGSGVTLYFPTGGITGSGSGSFNLSAPTSGTYEGIVLFEDRSNSSGITLSGSTGTQVNGVVYMPDGNLTYSGYSGTSGVATTIVVNNITFSGTSYINNAATSAYGGSGCPVVLIQ